MKPWVRFPHKSGVVVRSSDPSYWKMEARSSDVQGHSQFCSEFEDKLDLSLLKRTTAKTTTTHLSVSDGDSVVFPVSGSYRQLERA